jgi:hypothetical protein
VNGQPGDLAGQVPEGDVHRADGAQGGDPVALPQRLPQPLALQRILAHHHGLQVLDERFGVEVRAPHGRAQEGVALHAVVRAQGEQAQLALAREAAGVTSVLCGRDAVPREQRELEIGDLHVLPLFSGPGMCAESARGAGPCQG